MTTDPRFALNRLIGALEAHYDAAVNSQTPDAGIVLSAESNLRDAFFTYDNSLFTELGVELPFDMLDDEYEDIEDDLEEDDFEDDEGNEEEACDLDDSIERVNDRDFESF